MPLADVNFSFLQKGKYNRGTYNFGPVAVDVGLRLMIVSIDVTNFTDETQSIEVVPSLNIGGVNHTIFHFGISGGQPILIDRDGNPRIPPFITTMEVPLFRMGHEEDINDPSRTFSCTAILNGTPSQKFDISATVTLRDNSA